jgi:hypothetical protein
MNETFAVKAHRNTTIDVNGAGDNWIILPKVQVAIADGNAVVIDQSASGAVLDLYGTVKTTGHFIATDIFASDVAVVVADTGSIRSPEVTALHLWGDGATANNAGIIRGALGVWSEGDGSALTNTGSIIGRDGAVYTAGDEFEFINRGVVKSAGVALVSNGDANSNFHLSNYGDITALKNATAIQGNASNDAVDLHKGHVGGDILLGDGLDIFRYFGGTVDGYVNGGKTGDIYELHKAADIREDLDGGYDLVQSYVSWHLGKNFENLTLGGERNINAIGNGLDNQIIGNGGDNFLKGGAGSDTIYCSGGNDRVQGGSGSDHFNYSTDTIHILDFDAKSANHDTLRIDKINSGIGNWEEVQQAMHQKGSSVIIEGNDGQCILENVDIADLKQELFLYILV